MFLEMRPEKDQRKKDLQSISRLQGELGTADEKARGLVAEAIHALSSHSKLTLMTVSMSAISETLFESTLFGYKIEVSDLRGNKGRDGSRSLPYFVEVRTTSPAKLFTSASIKESEQGQNSF